VNQTGQDRTDGFMALETEILVIGGGPAGLAAAIAARKKGFEVTVADGAKPPIDKACGEGLMPNTLAALRELGIEIHPREGKSFRGVRFLEGSTTAEANFHGVSGVGLPRTVLHEKMVRRAQACGVSMRWNTTVSGLTEKGAILDGREMRAKWIIGADGIHSRIRNWIGLDSDSRQKMRFAQRRHYRIRPWTDYVEIYWGYMMQVYVTPLGEEETCVALISDNPRMRLEDAWHELPELAARLRNADPSGVDRGGATVTRRLSRMYRGNVILTGDASGSVDAITGEGLCLSFRQAIALAEGLASGSLNVSQAAHRSLLKEAQAMSRLLAWLGRHGNVRKRALQVFSRDPGLFARFLAKHVGQASAIQFAATGLRFGRQFLTA
jgi:flavin-dependent dehydrogenase